MFFLSPICDKNCHVHEKILSFLYIATQEFTWKKKAIFKQSAAPTLANARLRRHRPSAGGGAWACWDNNKDAPKLISFNEKKF